MEQPEIGVIVAVGPEGVGDGTLEVAAGEAARLGAGIELVHVVRTLVVAVPTHVEQEHAVDRALTKVGREVLTDAADRLRARVGDAVQVSTEIVSGPVTRTIVERGAEAGLIILEARAIGTVGRLVTRSISTGVAAHARVPVIVVPPSWQADVGTDLPITVGVDLPVEAARQVEPALRYARATSRPLVVLHAAWLAEPYQDVVFADYSRQQWVEDAEGDITTSLVGVATDEDDLSCDVHWARPIDALVKATQRSSLVVLNRRTVTRPFAAHLGPVTRTVLHHAECPVLVVDPQPEAPVEE